MISSAATAELTCPICLISSNDNDTNNGDRVKFLNTPCNHHFCQPCIERVLLKPRSDNIITMGPCPMCRVPVILFDLEYINSDNTTDSSSARYIGNSDVSTWPIANAQYKQRSLILMETDELLQRLISQKGVIEGYGITFCFQESKPSMEFSSNLNVVFDYDFKEGSNNKIDENLLPLSSIVFDTSYFHQKSKTFHGRIVFANPICNNNNNNSRNTHFYDRLHCTLHFADSGNYIREGHLRWKLASTTSQDYPLDGCWEVQYTAGTPITIIVQRHFFTCDGSNYQITIGDDNCPRFTWPNSLGYGGVDQVCNKPIQDIDESIEWTTSVSGYERIKWRRKSTSDDCWKVSTFKAGTIVYQKYNQHSGSSISLGPKHYPNQLWGNTFCQGFCVGMASYHFLKPDCNGNLHAYISYESPRTEMWPSLDNGDNVPSRVPFRNIQWNSETRTFNGDICWEEDFNTTWMGERLWKYEITFDSTFMFVLSGTVTRSTGEPHKFGIDLVYINAAIESTLKEELQNSQSTGGYLDTIRRFRDAGASPQTLAMLGEVAMNVMDDSGERMIDFNL